MNEPTPLEKNMPINAPLDFICASDIPVGEELFDDELIECVIHKRAMSALYGDSNSGKTFLAVDMAGAMAQGIKWMGRHTVKGAVVYLATEAYGSVMTRFKAYLKEHNLSRLDVFIVKSPVNLYAKPDDASRVIQTVDAIESKYRVKVGLVIGDTLARISSGANENSHDMATVITNAEIIKEETGAHFMWIHHCGKDAARGMRGWSGIRAAIDTEIELVESDDGVRGVTITKQRDGQGKGDTYGFELTQVPVGVNQWGAVRTSCVVRYCDAPAETKRVTKNGRLFDRALEYARAATGDIQREDVRTQYYLLHTGNTDAKRQAFNRDWAGFMNRATDAANQSERDK
jgi:RecA-family ATPase